MSTAIVIGGGGPAAAFPIGALDRLYEAGKTFDIWSLSGVGAWVGVVFNQWEETDYITRLAKTLEFIGKSAFVPDAQYRGFPLSPIFAPDFIGLQRALLGYIADTANYNSLVRPSELRKAIVKGIGLMVSGGSRDDFNSWAFEFAAAHPIGRLMTSAVWKSQTHGLTRGGRLASKNLNYPCLYKQDAFIYFNSFNMNRKKIVQFANRPIANGYYGVINSNSMDACTAMPFLETSIEIDGEHYCEGAMHSVLNFSGLLEENLDLEEIWVIRLVDDTHIKPPSNLVEGLSNLVMLPIGSLGATQLENFKEKIDNFGWQGKLYEVPVSSGVNFEWTHSNLLRGMLDGYAAVDEILTQEEKNHGLRKGNMA